MRDVKEKVKPSAYQQEIYSQLIATTNNLAIKATAGSGKTTTLVEMAKLLPYSKRAVFVAFNKHIVNELKNRLPRTMECSTMHSVGFAAIRKHYPGDVNLHDKKQIDFIMPLFAREQNQRKKWVSIYEVDGLMRLMRATMTELTDEGVSKLIEKYAVDIDTKLVPSAIRGLKQFYEFNSDHENKYSFKVDFQDMIEHVVRTPEIKMPQYDYVLVDECQDMSAMDQIFISRLVKSITGRRIIVGDENQAIYSFRGASVNSFKEMTAQANTIQLPLSICYRCAKAIVREAKAIYPDIEENPEQEEGIVRDGGEKLLEDIREGDMVISRNTRPLVSVFFKLIEMGKNAYILGRDIEKGLKALLVNIDDYFTLEQIEEEFEKRREKVKADLKAKGVINPDNNVRYIELTEKILILNILFQKFERVSAVEQFIEDTFDDEKRDGIQLSTIHKAKGMESERVFWIRSFEGKKLTPSKYAVTKDQLIQEKNLDFVATSRAKRELVYIDL